MNEKLQQDKEEEQIDYRTNKPEKSILEEVINAPITRQIGREIVRGLFGMLTGKKARLR